MKNRILLFLLNVCVFSFVFGQQTEVGVLIPKMPSEMREQISNVQNGMLVFDTKTNSFWMFQEETGWINLSELPSQNTQNGMLNSQQSAGLDSIIVSINNEKVFSIDSTKMGVLFPDSSTIIGHEAGSQNAFVEDQNDQGKFNTFLGMYSGHSNNPDPNVCDGYDYFNIYENGCGSHNTFLGNKSGYKNSVGRHNTFIGSRSGYQNLGTGFDFNIGEGGSGSENTYLGFLSGHENKNGYWNTFIGAYAGELNGTNNEISWSTNGSKNTYLGATAGRFVKEGFGNTYVGAEAGGELENTQGTRNTYLGHRAGYRVGGEDNVYLGYNAGEFYSPGELASERNVFIGAYAGAALNGEENVVIGNRAGEVAEGSRNIFIGNKAGENIVGNDNLIIDNGLGGTAFPFISGDFADKNLTIRGELVVEGDLGTSPIIAKQAGATKLRVHSNGGTSVGTNAIPPTNGLMVSGDLIYLGNTVVTSNSGLTFKVGTTTLTIQSSGDVIIDSSNSITIDAAKNLTLHADQNISIQAGSNLTLSGGVTTQLNGSIVRLNAPAGGVPTARIGSVVSGNTVVSGSNSVLIGN